MLSLLYPSMQGDSKTQTESILGFSSDENELPWARTIAAFDTDYTGACVDEFDGQCFRNQSTVSVSNSVWVHDGSSLNPAYENLVGDIVSETDFSAAEAGDLVNAWVEEATRGLIDTIVESAPLSPWILLAINAIYLKASWRLPFDDFRTTTDKFYTPDKLSVTRDDTIFMHQLERHPYSHTAIPGFQMVQLQFTSEPLSMILVQPSTAAGGTVTSTQVLAALPEIVDINTQHPRVALALPRFEMESIYTDILKTSLMDMGLTAPFAGNLCVYEDDCSPFLDVVLQKTYLSLDEKGVEAAAVTVGAVATSFPVDPPFEFLANAPFQFFIYDAATEVVIFEGRVVDPIPHANAPATTSTGKHSDPTFWTDQFGLEPEVVFNGTIVPLATTAPPTTTISTTTTSGCKTFRVLMTLAILCVSTILLS